MNEQLNELQKKRIECLSWKNIKPWHEQLLKAQEIEKNNCEVKLDDWLTVGKEADLTDEEKEVILQTAKTLIPWRKGPFNLFGLSSSILNI